MKKVTKTQRKILDRLIYPEPFKRVQQETGLTYGELRDDLIQLINAGCVEVTEGEGQKISYHNFYDADNLQLFTFRATKRGLTYI